MTPQRGFTLIEIAIVLVIITILIGGLAVPLSAQIQARRIAETRKTLEEAREAILGYAITHRTIGDRPFLPCPDTNGDGIEEPRVANTCPQQFGWLPWVTLGTGAQDAWGNRLRYATHTDVSNDNIGIHNNLRSPPGPVWNQICDTSSCGVANVAANVPVVVISHGPNGWGGRNVKNTTLAAPTGADELENLDANNLYVSRTPSQPGAPAGEFDDLTTWISFNVLINRVCPAGGCP